MQGRAILQLLGHLHLKLGLLQGLPLPLSPILQRVEFGRALAKQRCCLSCDTVQLQ